MARRKLVDWQPDDFKQWSAAQDGVALAGAAAAEERGPRMSLVPRPSSVPLDFLPDVVAAPSALVPAPAAPGSPDTAADTAKDTAADTAADTPAAGRAVAFDPEPSRKSVGGWSAERQRQFIAALAETGTVHLAARAAGLSARSAYALRIRSAPFARAWDAAQGLAVGRLSALAFDRAIHGRIRQVYSDGQLVGETREPSDKLLMWLLARLDPKRFAAPWERAAEGAADPQAEAQAAFPAMLEDLSDTPGG